MWETFGGGNIGGFGESAVICQIILLNELDEHQVFLQIFCDYWKVILLMKDSQVYSQTTN